MTVPDGPAARHRWIADGFGARVRGVGPDGWDAPAPVEGWAARDVVRHLVEWFPGFLAGGTDVVLPEGPPVDADPVGAWEVRASAVQALLDGDAGARAFDHPQVGAMPLDVAIDRFYTADVFLHTWDLARATGQDEALDPDLCAELLAGMEPMEELMRASGQYGPRVAVPDEADVQTRLLGFIGRRP